MVTQSTSEHGTKHPNSHHSSNPPIINKVLILTRTSPIPKLNKNYPDANQNLKKKSQLTINSHFYYSPWLGGKGKATPATLIDLHGCLIKICRRHHFTHAESHRHTLFTPFSLRLLANLLSKFLTPLLPSLSVRMFRFSLFPSGPSCPLAIAINGIYVYCFGLNSCSTSPGR